MRGAQSLRVDDGRFSFWEGKKLKGETSKRTKEKDRK